MAAAQLSAAGKASSHFPTHYAIALIFFLSSSQSCYSDRPPLPGRSTDVKSDRIFLSGAADTTQIFYNPLFTTGIKRHHLVCFHRGGSHHNNPYALNVEKGREKCCNELHQTGLLIEQEDVEYCLDHVAMVPNIIPIDRPNNKKSKEGPGKRAGEGKNDDDDDDDVRPAYYLAQDEAVPRQMEMETVSIEKLSDMLNSYEPSRQLKVSENGAMTILRDGKMGGGVMGAFSPFHLSDFASDGLDSGENQGVLLPLSGSVEGTLSDDGGMHRAFHQKMHLTLLHTIPNGGNSTTRNSSYRMDINATILLPITESVFIDADDPLLIEYERSGSPDGISCRATVNNNKFIEKSVSEKCDMTFVPTETIDIEQPAFASRQYVVAYRVSATLDLPFAQNSGANLGSKKELDVVVDYGTMLHIRYPSPVSTQFGKGSVPVVVQQPVLYSASVSIEGETTTNESSDFVAEYYTLRTATSTPTAATLKNNPPDPIIIHVAAGLDDDYWWVTVVTMSSALIGGLMLIKSLDSVSIWC